MLLSALRDAVAEICQEHHSSNISITVTSAGEICSDAGSFLAEYMSREAWLDIKHSLCTAISNLERCDMEVDELDLLALLSTAKVSVGLVQAHLLWPTPVDPIVTVRTKYQCLKNLVGNCAK